MKSIFPNFFLHAGFKDSYQIKYLQEFLVNNNITEMKLNWGV